MDNVIELLNLYWEWPIRKHGADIEVNVDELDMLRFFTSSLLFSQFLLEN